MIGYASRTGTRRNLDGLRAAGWGILVCASTRPSADHRTEGFDEVMIDNGAWKVREEPTAAARLAAWNRDYRESFEALVDSTPARLVVIPDIVAGGLDSLAHSAEWIGRLSHLSATLLLPVQDGMVAANVRPHVGRVGLFVGGSTAWKWETLATEWGPLAREVGCWLHVGRAGSGRMVERCGLAGADSFDTSEPSRYLCKLAGLDNARRQMPLIGVR